MIDGKNGLVVQRAMKAKNFNKSVHLPLFFYKNHKEGFVHSTKIFRSIPCGTLPRHKNVDNDFLKTFNPIFLKGKGGAASLNASFEEVYYLIKRGGGFLNFGRGLVVV